MTRTRKSAKAAGADFEIKLEQYLATELENPNIVRLRTSGKNDRGDIGNVRLPNGDLICVEAKNYGGEFKVGPWLTEAEVERKNYKADIGLVIAKRRGTTNMNDQVVFMTVENLIKLIKAGKR